MKTIYTTYKSSIYTLIPDIQHYIETEENWYAKSYQRLCDRGFQQSHGSRGGLRLSGLGDKCPRALWYSYHHPELAEPLPYHARFKYGYGHLVEGLVLELARLAGHTVEGEQDELVVDGIVGHRDAVVDGCVVDVKSASSISFNKIKDGLLAVDDAFGYLYQLDGYLLGSSMDPLVTVKDKGYILAIDKTLGHMALYEHKLREEILVTRIREYRKIVNGDRPPPCRCGVKAVGGSGNIGLDIRASYSPYKHLCFPELRTFLYAHGPVHLTKVVRTPDVPELSRPRLCDPGRELQLQETV